MVVAFADFTLDVATRRLLRAGAEVHLSPKAFDLLALLVQHRAEAMAKADLRARLWPATHVADGNLASLVAELRRALDDSADAPRFIRTVPRFGYWFIAAGAAGAGTMSALESRPRCWLVWDEKLVPLEAGENIVGRAPDATVWIDVRGVSRRHAVVRLTDAGATVEDLGSKNGTFVGDERVTEPRALADGDTVRFGSLDTTFRVPASPDLTESLDSE